MQPLILSKLATAAALGLLLTSCGPTPVTPPPVKARDLPIVYQSSKSAYSRTVQSGTDTFSLQTGCRLFRKAGSADIDLVGTIHVADASYYQKIQAELTKADLVLCEGVTDDNQEILTEKETAKFYDQSLYGRLAKSLGMISQYKAIDYSELKFRNCDMTEQQMQAALQHEIAKEGNQSASAVVTKEEYNEASGSLAGNSWFYNSLVRVLGMSPSSKAMARFMIVTSGKIDNNTSSYTPRLERLLLEDRNAHVMSELKTVLRKENHHRIAIFYGSDHMDDMQRRLLKMGYHPVGGIRWFDSVTCHPYSSGLTQEEVTEILR